MPQRFPTIIALLGVITVLPLATDSLLACTTFSVVQETARIFGKNYDWEIGDGLVVINPRGLIRGGDSTWPIEGVPSRRALMWRAKYGSVTFNQYGVGHPIGGMNERGLVVETMWLKTSRYPMVDTLPSIGVLDWVQYQLDCHATVDEILSHLDRVNIASKIPVHFHVADTTGAAAIIEFIDGKLITRTGDDAPVKILTNTPYQTSLDYLFTCAGFGGTVAPTTATSLDRFARAAALVRDAPTDGGKRNLIEYGFYVLDQVAQERLTQWSVIYDLRRRRIHFRTQTHRNVKYIDVRPINFECSEPVMIMNIEQRPAGAIARRFQPFTIEANRDLLLKTFRATDFLKSVQDSQLEALAAEPAQLRCDDRIQPLR